MTDEEREAVMRAVREHLEGIRRTDAAQEPQDVAEIEHVSYEKVREGNE